MNGLFELGKLKLEIYPCQHDCLQFSELLLPLLGMELQHCQGRSLLTTLSKLESDTDREAQRPDKLLYLLIRNYF